MPRVTLAHWHNGRAPGDELDVTDAELANLRRDGRIANVLDGPGTQPEPSSTPAPDDQPAAKPEPQAVEAAPEEPAPAGRKRR
ncbi:hypothetical protein OG742_37100 [Streptomyces sp. NBC_00828]|uniref:hypothetical protein n=1 Tax=Streptomyces sp. NBC_00828 TaxID=2903678 RepID=UPI00386B8EBD